MWTNEASENQFERVAQFVTSCSEAEWRAVVEKYSPIVMEFDPFNSLITETVRKCLVTHSPDMAQMRSLIAEIYG
jgi:surface carbohydrate biosynthesis protein